MLKVRRLCDRADSLAARLESGARALVEFARDLTDAEWQIRLPGDGRTVGVVVHHVASVYPIQIRFAQTIASGTALSGITMADLHVLNADHAGEHQEATREAALDLLRRNSSAAAAAIRALGDDELDRVAPASLYGGAPVSCQFVLEDHALRHSYHHLARIRVVLRR